MRLKDHIARYWDQRPIGLVVDEPQVNQCAYEALVFYTGWQRLQIFDILKSCATELCREPFIPIYPITIDNYLDACVNESEWAVMGRLFKLYVEKQNAIILESSRGLGVDPYGRDSSTISSDIQMCEEQMPRLSFMEEIFSIK